MRNFRTPKSADDDSRLSRWQRAIFSDWEANAGSRDSQIILAMFRQAQWSNTHWGKWSKLFTVPYWWIVSVVVGIELPPELRVGPRLRIFHPHGIVVNFNAIIGSDCILRHGVTIGNKVDSFGNQSSSPRLGDRVELGAGCAVIGDIELEDDCCVGALAVVTKSVAARAVMAGNPARQISTRESPNFTDPVIDLASHRE